eukprot:COSAG01_NODE_2771_length_7101_cov_12.982148_12_plen_137_part_00
MEGQWLAVPGLGSQPTQSEAHLVEFVGGHALALSLQRRAVQPHIIKAMWLVSGGHGASFKSGESARRRHTSHAQRTGSKRGDGEGRGRGRRPTRRMFFRKIWAWRKSGSSCQPRWQPTRPAQLTNTPRSTNSIERT